MDWKIENYNSLTVNWIFIVKLRIWMYIFLWKTVTIICIVIINCMLCAIVKKSILFIPKVKTSFAAFSCFYGFKNISYFCYYISIENLVGQFTSNYSLLIFLMILFTQNEWFSVILRLCICFINYLDENLTMNFHGIDCAWNRAIKIEVNNKKLNYFFRLEILQNPNK